MENTLNNVLNQQNRQSIQNEDETITAKVQIARLKQQNKSLVQSLAAKEIIIQQKEQIILQLKKNTTSQGQSIDKLTVQLNKVQKLLQQFLKKAKTRPRQHLYHTPQIKKYQFSSVIQADQQAEPYKYQYLYRSPKTDEHLSNKYSPNINTNLSSSYIIHSNLSPYQSKGLNKNNYKTDSMNNLRRQMLMKSKNMDDLLKMQKACDKSVLK